jgi:hypothetical protein
MKTSLRLARPGSFWVTAMVSTLLLFGIVYPWLGAHSELLAIPIVGGTILTFYSQVSAIGIRTLVKRPSISSELIAFENERRLAWLADVKYRAFLADSFRMSLAENGDTVRRKQRQAD